MNRIAVNLALCLIVVLSSNFPSYAIMMCSEPRDPGCPIFGNFDDQFAFDSCKAEMESYANRVDRYLQCLNDEKSGVVKKYNKSVERFNCFASGNDICF